MDGERMDSLDGWVAVRPNVFLEPEQYKMGFIVAWNQVDSKFAVTCHNRTAQRRKRREGEDGEQSSWAGLYTVQDLEHIHRQLSSVCSRLQPCFPRLPAQLPAGSLWTLLFPNAPSWEGSSEEVDAVCRTLERYLGAAIEECGRQIVLDVLFPEDVEDAEKYFENLHEFRKKSLEEQVCRAKEAVRTILHQHKNADKMMSLLKVYEEEDEAFMELVTVATQFHQYLLQPFRDMRELAILYKLEILKSLEMEDLGPKRIEALQKEADKWNTTAEEAERSIRNITVDYFKETSKALSAMQKHMELDRRRFGQATWASAVPRLERIKSMLAKESLQHMRSKELCLNQKRADIKLSMENLINCEGAIACLDRLELQYYETQLELYDVQFDILKHEEMLLITELDTLRRQMKEHLPAFSCTFIGTYGVRVQIMAMNGSATVSYECCAYQSNLLPLGYVSTCRITSCNRPIRSVQMLQYSGWDFMKSCLHYACRAASGATLPTAACLFILRRLSVYEYDAGMNTSGITARTTGRRFGQSGVSAASKAQRLCPVDT
ncbi:unnamed protein product [Ranitomeya imitator]|uniref:Uncharacterized protein n=1 Tax=Ranitomeya imitator TaxID=111125 RepID=A0ABN9M5X5_9NEOB|nr:unnamed protein product [Ranitomeya imitator]